MLVVIFLALFSQISLVAVRHACVPNTQFVLNGKTCPCDDYGWWTEANCFIINRRSCLPGQITWEGCSRCICQENGELICNNEGCPDENEKDIPASLFINEELASTRCTPFKSFYINCSICVCPASGHTADARCVKDKFCQKPPSTSDFLPSANNVCIPKVMYLFPCLHCLCPDGGFFVRDKCVETCYQQQQTALPRRCIPRTFYRRNCNICWCPDNSIPDDNSCTKSICRKKSKFKPLDVLRTTRKTCRPNGFIEPKCFYCACAPNGNVNEKACLEQGCMKIKNIKYAVSKKTCSPGEMVAHCVECFCLRNRTSTEKYCSSECSYQSKLNVLERILNDSNINHDLIDLEKIRKASDNEKCEPNSTYLDQGRYCLCPENGSTNFKLCTSIAEDFQPLHPSVSNIIQMHRNEPCKPNTFVEIDCNTCYCSPNGTIDPKWCTYDDCAAKKIIQDSQKVVRLSRNTINNNVDDTCIPGSISKVDCNFCICPNNGISRDRACTKNKCSEVDLDVNEDKFTCEPLAYYLVDCNVCLCPRDGIKNVEKCTKKICEKTYLRTDSCIPGQFFSNDCNVCVCPPNGDKMDSVCTNHQCSDADTPWKRIFKLSQSVLDSSMSNAKISNKDVEVCFSGEEFEIGCKICVCSDVGLRAFAVCTESACDEQKGKIEAVNQNIESGVEELIGSDLALSRSKRNRRDMSCSTVNVSTSEEKKACTPGSMYIIRCMQCICPYMGNINRFCRPLPNNFYCEQAYPNFNYLPMGRKQENATNSITAAQIKEAMQLQPVDHQHTFYNCTRAGRILDKCFICECEAWQGHLTIIEEHCFQSNAEACQNTSPSFLDKVNKVAIG